LETNIFAKQPNLSQKNLLNFTLVILKSVTKGQKNNTFLLQINLHQTFTGKVLNKYFLEIYKKMC